MDRRRVSMTALLLLSTISGCSESSVPVTPSNSTSILSGTIAVGVTNDSPGFANGGEAGNPAGFDIQVMRALDEPSIRKTAPTILTVANRGTSLKDLSAELVIATYSITTERNAQGIDFAGPYLATPQALLVKAENNDIKTRYDLRGKDVCKVGNTTGGKVEIPGANMSDPAPTTAACVERLSRGNVHAVFDDELILIGFSDANPGEYKVILPNIFGTGQLYGIAMLKGRPNDCKKINEIVRKYLRERWLTDFRAALPGAVKAYPADFETRFKPSETDMQRVGCQLQ